MDGNRPPTATAVEPNSTTSIPTIHLQQSRSSNSPSATYQHDLMKTMAELIADVASGISSQAQYHDPRRKLNRLLTGFWATLSKQGPRLVQDPRLSNDFRRVRESLDCLLGQKMETLFAEYQTEDARQKQRVCAEIRKILLRADLSRCISALEKWQKARKTALPSNGAGSSSEAKPEDSMGHDPNPPTQKHPAPTIKYTVFHGETSTHHKIDRLHAILHGNFPCTDKAHAEKDHKMKLEESDEAWICLTPRWGIDEEQNSFRILLTSQIARFGQECEIAFNTTRYLSTPRSLPLCKTAPKCDFCYEVGVRPDNGLFVWQITRLQVAPTGSSIQMISLQQIIDKVHLPIAVKRLIALALTRALLHLLGTDWIYHPLSADRVYFRHTPGHEGTDGDPDIDFDNILLSTRLRVTQTADSPPRRAIDSIFDLAVILAKLELGEHFHRANEELRDKQVNPTAVASTLLKWCGQYSEELPRTIQFCFQFPQQPSAGEYCRLGPRELLSRREFVNEYYKKAIRPIEGCLIKIGWTLKQVNGLMDYPINRRAIYYRAQSYGGVIVPRPTAPSRPLVITTPAFQLAPSQEYNADFQIPWSGQPPGCVMDCYTSHSTLPAESADRWMEQLKEQYQRIYSPDIIRHPTFRNDLIPSVAIIDTGCQLEHHLIKPYVASGRIAGFRDFVRDTDTMADEDGHGTHVTHLLLQAAPYVKLYIARAFQMSHADERTASYVSKALKHALEVWNVDIISLSFAFWEEDPDIQNTIRKATRKPVLVFAAASNNSADKPHPRGYPARESDVICVHSTDDQGNQSKFSPAGMERSFNFAILGENLNAAWPLDCATAAPISAELKEHLVGSVGGTSPSNQGTRRMSGTSQATPLLAGIASTILHITRLKPFGRFDAKEAKLKHARGMQRVLYQCMACEETAPKYNHVRPGALFGMERKDILKEIESALRKAYGTAR